MITFEMIKSVHSLFNVKMAKLMVDLREDSKNKATLKYLQTGGVWEEVEQVLWEHIPFVCVTKESHFNLADDMETDEYVKLCDWIYKNYTHEIKDLL